MHITFSNTSFVVLRSRCDVTLDSRRAAYSCGCNSVINCQYHNLLNLLLCNKIDFVLQCGWANASDAIEIMCISFTIDSLKDSLNIQSAQGTLLSVVLFLGESNISHGRTQGRDFVGRNPSCLEAKAILFIYN